MKQSERKALNRELARRARQRRVGADIAHSSKFGELLREALRRGEEQDVRDSQLELPREPEQLTIWSSI